MSFSSCLFSSLSSSSLTLSWLFQLCEPVKRLSKCRYFRDVTWTLTSGPDNVTQQTVHCHCPKGAVAYLIKQQAFQNRDGQIGYQYSFACSPQSVSRPFLFSNSKRGFWLNEYIFTTNNSSYQINNSYIDEIVCAWCLHVLTVILPED